MLPCVSVPEYPISAFQTVFCEIELRIYLLSVCSEFAIFYFTRDCFVYTFLKLITFFIVNKNNYYIRCDWFVKIEFSLFLSSLSI